MRRIVLLLVLVTGTIAACQSASLTPTEHSIPASPQLAAELVADPCAANGSETACKANSACSWSSVACPPDADCPAAVCATVDSCSAHADSRACSGDARCAWTATQGTAQMPALCPVGHDCTATGYCLARDVTGAGCGCVQPIACPASGSCPTVSCDCPPPPPTADTVPAVGGGTCSCSCPACLPGEACPPCRCDCGAGGSGGGAGTTGAGGSGGATGTGGSGGGEACGPGAGGGGGGTCTCNCPECPAGQDCPACSCSCGAMTTMTTTMSGGSGPTGGAASGASGGSSGSTVVLPICVCPACPAGAACAPCDCATPQPVDPCTAYSDAATCAADSADSCTWIQLGIACITTPCPSGSCMRMSPPADAGTGGSSGSGGGGCACACAACPAGATCPPCSCNCCSPPTTGTTIVETPQTPQPVAASKT
ncbi:MAG TPA: hypothetical protein VMT03_12190 [Polyangia bacterium]|nr:hypothetical protein [Polyangia bacterium]